MMFMAIVLGQEGNIRPFALVNTELEVGLELLNSIVKQGDRIIEAKILDHGKLIELPIEAFDGTSCLPAIKNLMTECQQILKESINNRFTYELAPIDALKFHRICVTRTELAVTHFEQRLHQTRQATLFEPQQSIKLRQLQATLSQWRTALANARNHLLNSSGPPL